MFRRFSVNFAVTSILLDAALVAGALGLAGALRPLAGALPFVLPLTYKPLPRDLYLVFPLIWSGVLLLLSVYDGRRNFRVQDELGSLSLAVLLAAVSSAGVLYLTYREVSRFTFLTFIGVAFGLLAGWRLLARLAFRWRGQRIAQRRVLIAGAGIVGRQVQAQIQAAPSLGLRLAGFLDDDPAKQASGDGVLGPLEAVRQVVARQGIDDVVVALPRSADQRLTRLVAVLHDLPVRVWVIPDYFALALHRASVEEFAGLPMLDLRAPALTDYQRMLKRAFDLVLTALLLVPALPLMAAIAALIRLDSPGPVFYRQKRVGENGRLFDMLKFRTMVENAEALRGMVEGQDEQGRLLQNKGPGDPRVTRVGRMLRRSSLDELPQLFNVLKGEMSLIGPRPELPYYVERYELWQRKRFAVPQGLTGWWQVNGRSDKPMHLHTEEDLYYVQHYSLWLDVQILLKTIWVVLRGKGAY